MFSSKPFLGLLFLLLAAPAFAQTPATQEAGSTTASASTNDSGPAGIIPEVKGFNASLGTSSQHDSSNGWSSVLTPNVAYRLNRFFSADVGVPIYGYINVDANTGTKAKPIYGYATKRGVLGDTALSVHGEAHPDFFDYNGSATLGLPSGNTNYGLGAGQVTYNFNNHFEHEFGIFAPDIELGIADSSALIGARVRKSYVSVGTLAHFQAGGSFELPHDLSFEVEAYEELPLTTSTIYSTTGKGKKKVTTATNTGAAEDNGFSTSLDIPLQRHITLSGFYNRSLRNKIDTAGFSFTFLLRAKPKQKE
ncbi:hypothetical protein SAMN05421770_10619 [Granulicella rosea]|uniref:MetA-pathway of phenol degradation n=1 Tax=Granulicella rosea TaxID=474952 RepID=A0A239L243_9BACT|nr:hypothetical protein [Granulicella rosea]SNT23978.1 hypothetical protein SAMN05421770_10619 [Granulicella rosea]